MPLTVRHTCVHVLLLRMVPFMLTGRESMTWPRSYRKNKQTEREYSIKSNRAERERKEKRSRGREQKKTLKEVQSYPSWMGLWP